MAGVGIGFVADLSSLASLTFVAHRRLPYRRMLVLTGFLLGLVLLVMVGRAGAGDAARELAADHARGARSQRIIPNWMGLWFAVFPTVETLTAQMLAAVLVVGWYLLARAPVDQRVAIELITQWPRRRAGSS